MPVLIAILSSTFVCLLQLLSFLEPSPSPPACDSPQAKSSPNATVQSPPACCLISPPQRDPRYSSPCNGFLALPSFCSPVLAMAVTSVPICSSPYRECIFPSPRFLSASLPKADPGSLHSLCGASLDRVPYLVSHTPLPGSPS